MINDFEYETVIVSRHRLGTIKIRRYSNYALRAMFRRRRFDTRTAFMVFAVSLLLCDHAETFATIDRSNISKEVPPVTLIQELFDICRKYNPIIHDLMTNGNYVNVPKGPFLKGGKLEISVDKLAGWMLAKGHKGLANDEDCDDDNWTDDLMDGLEELYRLETIVNQVMCEQK